MTEYITKERAQDLIVTAAHGNGSRLAHMLGKLEDEPPDDVAPVVQARWIDKTEEPGEGYWECSNCGLAWVLNDGTPVENEMHFCPKCGARMGGDE